MLNGNFTSTIKNDVANEDVSLNDNHSNHIIGIMIYLLTI